MSANIDCCDDGDEGNDYDVNDDDDDNDFHNDNNFHDDNDNDFHDGNDYGRIIFNLFRLFHFGELPQLSGGFTFFKFLSLMMTRIMKIAVLLMLMLMIW